MNQLTTAKRVAVVSALVEGMSIRATVRMAGVAKNTVVKLLRDLGDACAEFHVETARDLPCKRVQADEIWSFCYAKDKNVPASMMGKPGVGSVWTWTAIDADSKFIVSPVRRGPPTSPNTTSAASTRPSARRPPWRWESPIMSGRWKT